MCPACQDQANRPKTVPPHPQQIRYASDFRHLDGIGPMVVEFFLCDRCRTRMQRDCSGMGRRQQWRMIRPAQAVELGGAPSGLRAVER